MYCILCDSRGEFETMIALVDRRKTRSKWWTAVDSSVMLCFKDLDAAKIVANKFKYNNSSVVPYEKAKRIIDSQRDARLFDEAQYDPSWDAHKESIFGEK